jgi:hypothetical protein
LAEGGVALVQISGCPTSFRMLVQQWELQRLGRFVSPPSRRPFSVVQKNAWTKWSRLYNLVLEQAGFQPLKHGRCPFPVDVTPAESSQRMNDAASYYDAARGNDSTDKFYKSLVRMNQTDGTVERRVRNRNDGI